MITDHKSLISIFKKDVSFLSQSLKIILLSIQQYNIRILYNPGPQLLFADWLSRHNHEIKRDKEISGMCITIIVIESCKDIPDCMTAEEIRD